MLRSKITGKLLAIYLLAISILIAIAVASMVFQVSIARFTRDVTAIADIHPFTGILSNLGIYLWCISATASFFAAMVLRDIKRTKNFSFLLYSAILSTYLMLDDAFLFHETLAPKLFGISEKAVFVILGIAILLYLKSFIQVLFETKYVTFVLAIALLSLSVITDSIQEPWLRQLGQWELFIEDGAKWLGIVSWCIYHVHTAFLFVVYAYKFPIKSNELGQ